MIERLVSGGQTGADRAALDVALELGIACGGWCPQGRRSEDGVIPGKYPLKETEARSYSKRTKLNVMDSDGTLVINQGVLEGGTAYTVHLAEKLKKPCLVINTEQPGVVDEVVAWIVENNIRVLNVAGPRESKRPGIASQANEILRKAILRLSG